MSERTKAELQEALDSAIALNKRYERERQETDPEARAIADCIKAVSGLNARTVSGYSQEGPDRPAIRRVLNATAAKFGVQPDYETLARLVEGQEKAKALTEGERQELDRLRRFEQMIQSAQYPDMYR